MLRKIKLHPGGNSTVLNVPVFSDFGDWHTSSIWTPYMEHDDSSTELWVDCGLERKQLSLAQTVNMKLLEQAEHIVVYDWFHAAASLTEKLISWVNDISNIRPTKWITICANPVTDIECAYYDYYWNRTKLVFTKQIQTWKQQYPQNFVQYPVHTRPRKHKVLNYHARSDPLRSRLNEYLKQNFNGCYNSSKDNFYLPTNCESSDPGHADPPGRMYYDESYVTCMVESRYLGNRIVVSEKTYDNLIQGRCVMNFASQGFYQHLRQEGWQFPNDIDYSWDSIENDEERFDAYLDSVTRLLSMSQSCMHDWFLSNMDCWVHNQQMLHSKPYDYIN